MGWRGILGVGKVHAKTLSHASALLRRISAQTIVAHRDYRQFLPVLAHRRLSSEAAETISSLQRCGTVLPFLSLRRKVRKPIYSRGISSAILTMQLTVSVITSLVEGEGQQLQCLLFACERPQLSPFVYIALMYVVIVEESAPSDAQQVGP